ncbi:hypothetical protein RvY_05526 [Ramazzottius varieornatus]|uniref:Trichohyalin-plectin-homology domain-containing protein n=1 Tax=Ramazzottius varieornatus TaxID=947166 RepID=A0A1D1V202_RAMVA|nr:hypothetical protein RvY_05526 [Ramazzottius varieornatus]
MVRGEGKMFLNRPPSVELTKREKLQRIRELIRQRRLPVWCDPYVPRWTPPKDALSNHQQEDANRVKQERLKDFREWYLARDTGQFEEKRQANREKAEVDAQLYYDEMEISDRVAELQDVLKNDEQQIKSELRAYHAAQPSDLEAKRERTIFLKDKHHREEAAFVEKQRERQWKSSTAAEEIRRWEAKAHKEQAARDLEELQYFKLLEKLEDTEVDMYFEKLRLARIAKERKDMDEREREHQVLEWRGQNALIEQMLEHAHKKEEAAKKKETETYERIHFEERLKFDAFKDRFEDHIEKLRLRDELTHQVKSKYMVLEKKKQDEIDRKAMVAWQKQLVEEGEEQNASKRKLKAALYKRQLEGIAYKKLLKEVSNQSQIARDKAVAEYVKEMQLDALYTYLDCLKTRQGLQSRTDKELAFQIKTHAAEKIAKEAAKVHELEQERTQQAKHKAYLAQKAAEKRHQQRISAHVLKAQAADKTFKEQQVAAQDLQFGLDQEAKRVAEDEYIGKMASQLGFPVPSRVTKFSI